MNFFEWYTEKMFDSGFMGDWFGTKEGVWIYVSPLTVVLFMIGIVVVGYLIGSLNFALIISKFRYHDDVRLHGSNNAGTTNMLRVYGKGAAAATLVADILKGALVGFLGVIFGGQDLAFLGALACIVGHAFPVFFKFKGGKGVACAAGAILVVEPVLLLICVILFALTVATTKYVSLGSIVAAGMFPVMYSGMYKMLHFPSLEGEVFPPFIAIVSAILMAVVIIALHRKNISRIMNKTENKISFRKKSVDQDEK